MPDLVHDPGGAHLKPRVRALLALGMAAIFILIVPAFLYVAHVMALALGLDPDAPLWSQARSDVWVVLVLVEMFVWIAVAYACHKAILLAALRRRGVVRGNAGWLSSLESWYPAEWLEAGPGRHTGSLFMPWGWAHVRGGPDVGVAVVFVLFCVALWWFARGTPDITVSAAGIILVAVAIVAILLAIWWASLLVVAIVSFARGRLTVDEVLRLMLRGQCPESWKKDASV